MWIRGHDPCTLDGFAGERTLFHEGTTGHRPGGVRHISTQLDSPSEPEFLTDPIQATKIYGAGYGTLPDKTPVIAVVVTASPGILTVVDPRTDRVVFEGRLPGPDAGAWAVTVASDGHIYIGGNSGNLYVWDFSTQLVTKLHHVDDFLFASCHAPDGRLYVGGYRSGHLYCHDPASGGVSDLGKMGSMVEYVRSIAWHDGRLYVGVGTPAELLCVDPVSTAVRRMELPPDLAKGSMVRGLSVADDHLLGWVPGSGRSFVFDLVSERVVRTFPEPMANAAVASPPRDGGAYLLDAAGALVRYGLRTDAFSPVGPRFDHPSNDYGWVDLDEGTTLVTVSSNGELLSCALGSGTVTTRPLPLPTAPVTIQCLGLGPDGGIYCSGYPGGTGARYDLATGKTAIFPFGQAEGMGDLDGTLYAGMYSGALLFRVRLGPDGQPSAEYLLSIGEDQDRPFAFTAGDGKLFIGTIPTYGQIGGAVATYDPSTRSVQTHRHVIADQSVINLAYHDGLVYGTTSVWGGLGVAPVATAATVFQWDPADKRVVRSMPPRSPIFDQAPKAINRLGFGPDGRLWAGWQGTLCELDPKTLRVLRARVYYSSNWNLTHSWQPQPLVFGPSGRMYATLMPQGVLAAIDPETLELEILDRTASRLIGAPDGYLYYNKGSRLFRLPLR